MTPVKEIAYSLYFRAINIVVFKQDAGANIQIFEELHVFECLNRWALMPNRYRYGTVNLIGYYDRSPFYGTAANNPIKYF